MRVGEVAALTWGDVVNAEGRVKDQIRLNADQTKGGHPRIVFLSPKLLKELEAYVSTAKRREAHWAFFATVSAPVARIWLDSPANSYRLPTPITAWGWCFQPPPIPWTTRGCLAGALGGS